MQKRNCTNTISHTVMHKKKSEKTSATTPFYRKKFLRKIEMATSPHEAELYIDPYDMAAQKTPETAWCRQNAQESKTLKEKNEENRHTISNNPHSLMDDMDFVAAVEDVHSWLGQILRQEPH